MWAVPQEFYIPNLTTKPVKLFKVRSSCGRKYGFAKESDGAKAVTRLSSSGGINAQDLVLCNFIRDTAEQ